MASHPTDASKTTTSVGFFKKLFTREFLLGDRYSEENVRHTKVNKRIGLAVFSSDALSSVAYATQSMMDTISIASPGLLFAGALYGAYAWSWPIALGITVLLVILMASYSQTIRAYPTGGGAYLVARDNLNENFSQVAGASLLLDYVLTVAVSVSAGVSALTSAFPVLESHRILWAGIVILLVGWANLRGTKESGLLFSFPTYGFLISIFSLIGIGFYQVWAHPAVEGAVVTASSGSNMGGTTTLAAIWIFARAYAAGCTALTGVEAISDGIPNFKAPAEVNAVITLRWMVFLLASMFLGITYLAVHFQLSHSANTTETLLSMLVRKILAVDQTHWWNQIYYYVVQGFTMAILFLAANTAYADFPRLASLLARDKYLPKQLMQQGQRLVFSNGILVLSALAFILVYLFNAKEHALLDLYAFGVFLGFSISQTSMTLKWWRSREAGWKSKLVLNALGAITTTGVLIIITLTKFTHGIWAVMLAITGCMYLFRSISSHYAKVKTRLNESTLGPALHQENIVFVLVSGMHRGVLSSLNYAKKISETGKIEALMVNLINEKGESSSDFIQLHERWWEIGAGIKFTEIQNHQRQIIEPLLSKIINTRNTTPEATVTVVIPEYITGFWENILHNQTALMLKFRLLKEPNIIVISIPYHID